MGTRGKSGSTKSDSKKSDSKKKGAVAAKPDTEAKNAAAARDKLARKAEAEASRDASEAKLETQLTAWSTKLDDLVAGRVAAGAQVHDPYHARIEAMRTSYTSVRARFDAYLARADGGGSWAALRSAIKEDMAGLESSFEDLTR